MSEKADEGIVTTTKLNGDDVLRAVNEAWQRTVKYIYKNQSTSQELVRKANGFFEEIIRDLEYNASLYHEILCLFVFSSVEINN